MILEDIEVRGAGTIEEFSQKYRVSAMTIRRDLQVLEEEGYIEKTYGGAIRKRTSVISDDYAAKQKIAYEQKRRIAEYAAQNFILSGDILILEGGTTVAGVIPYLDKQERLTVITHSLYVAKELQSFLPCFSVICTGGLLRDDSFTFVGPITERVLSEFHANKAFLSFTGLTLEDGFTDPSILETQVKRAIISAADQVIVLLDSTKIGVRSLTTVMSLIEADVLITDADAPADALERLQQLGIDVHIAL